MRADLLILGYLASFGPSYGLDIVRYGISSRGSIYVHLARMEEEGLVESWTPEGQDTSDGRLPRRKYRITAVGRRVLPSGEQVIQRRLDAFGELCKNLTDVHRGLTWWDFAPPIMAALGIVAALLYVFLSHP